MFVKALEYGSASFGLVRDLGLLRTRSAVDYKSYRSTN